MSESRTSRVSRNVTVGFISKIAVMAFAFITRTIFIRILGVEYNGVNGLYSNILSFLALSELGLGNVLNFTLYTALRNNDKEKVRSLVYFFRKIYFGIATAVSVIGFLLVPFLPYIVNSNLPQEELVTYYILYLINSVVSYFVVYKTTVIIADQNYYISSICETITIIAMDLAQIICLFVFKSFLVYLVIQVVFTILKNLALNYIANKRYPYLKHMDSNVTGLTIEDKSFIKENIKSTFLYKISSVILNNTDNILISIIVGTTYVGYYSNYFLIIHYITTIISIYINGIIASLGNLNAEKDSRASYRMFKILSLIFCFIGAVSFCCILNCIQPFVRIWIGKQNVMPYSWVVVIAINMLLTIVMNPIWMFRETMGLFKQVRFILVITAILNVILSILLGQYYGVPGILGATFISKIASQYWFEPRVLFRELKIPIHYFYQNQLKQFIAIALAAGISFFVCGFLGTNFINVLLRAIFSAAIGLLIVWLFNWKSETMIELREKYVKLYVVKIKKVIKRKR